MLDLLQAAILAGAALTTGLTAGLLFAFRYSVMPGLSRTDDRTFIATMTAVNVAILNGWFLTSFVGGLLLTLGAAALHLPNGGPVFPWVAAAAVLYLATLVVTGSRHVPLNEQLDGTAVDGDPAEHARARAAFEAPWNRWHTVRTTTSVAAFACLLIAALIR